MSKSFKIWIEDKKTFEKVVKQMDKDGIRWGTDEDLASFDFNPNFPIALFVDRDNELSWSADKEWFKNYRYSEITPEEYLKENKTMTKADLKDWMIVETAKQSIFLVDKTHGYLIHSSEHLSLSSYTDDLKHTHSHYGQDYSIVRVYEPKRGSEFLLKLYLDGTIHSFPNIEENLNLIWRREEESVEMTITEIEEKLGIKNLKIVKENKDD